MKSTRNYSLMIGLMILFLLVLGAGTGSAAVYDLCVDADTVSMPDGASIPVWGFGLADTNGNCAGGVSVPGPELAVPPGDSTLQINLTNHLQEPVSLHILGQVLSNNSGPTFTTGAAGHDTGLRRVMSFSHEAAPGGGTATYTWNNFRPGTYLLQSGTNPAKQVQMGLYAVAKKDQAAGSAYDGQPYDTEATIVFHDIDPEIHQAVADGRYGANPASATGPYIPSSALRVPRYFMINGAAYPQTDTALPAVGVGQRVLLRIVNAGLVTHVPQVPDHYMTLIAEDGNPYPYPQERYGFELAPAKTMDAIIEPAAEGALAVYDGRLKLSNAGAPSMGGMLALLTVGAGGGITPPLAVADAYSTLVDTPLSVAAPGVLGNDLQRGAASMTAVLDAGAASGALSLNSDGSFSYTPGSGFSGSDSFAYHVEGSDGGGGTLLSNTVTVSLTVNAANSAPVATNDSYSTDENMALTVTAPGVLGNDTDADNDGLSAELVTTTASGNLTLNADGSFTYTPNVNFSGVDIFTYRADDGSAQSNIATVTITVNNVVDTVTIGSVRFTANNRRLLEVRADSTAPDNSVTLTTTISGTGGGPVSGALSFNAATGDYAARFRMPNRFVPASVTVTSSQGGSATATGPFPVGN